MKFLKSPLAMLGGIVLGIVIGLFCKPAVPFLSPVSELYLSLLQMCVLPMVACTICINIGTIFSSGLGKVVWRWLVAIVAAFLVAAVIGVGVGFLLRGFMAPSEEAKIIFARMQGGETSTLDLFTRIEYYGANVPAAPAEQATALDFLLRSVPANIFRALAEGQTMQVILFFCVLGIMLTKISKSYSTPIVNALDGVYRALCEFVNKLLLFLPFAMCAMLAVQLSDEGMLEMALPLLRLILVIHAAMLLIVALTLVLVQRFTRCTLSEHWRAIKRTLLIALGTRSCLASIPVALEDIEELHLDRTVTNSVLPICITMCQPGVVSCGAIAAVFATTIYDVPINSGAISIIIVGAIVFSISIIGVPGVVAVNMLSLILEPLGIPSELIIIIYLATIPIFDPASVFASVYSNFALTAFVSGRRRGRDKHGEAAASALHATP